MDGTVARRHPSVTSAMHVRARRELVTLIFGRKSSSKFLFTLSTVGGACRLLTEKTRVTTSNFEVTSVSVPDVVREAHNRSVVNSALRALIYASCASHASCRRIEQMIQYCSYGTSDLKVTKPQPIRRLRLAKHSQVTRLSAKALRFFR